MLTPILAMAGIKGLGTKVGQGASMVAENVEAHTSADCGHFLPEERPLEIVEQIVAMAHGAQEIRGAPAESNSPQHSRSAIMTRVLFVGQQPETVDFSDPALPPGFSAQKINAGIAIGKAKIEERGWKADLCMIPPDQTAGPMLEKQLELASYDCVVIGGGLRLPPKSLLLFETVVNAVHKAAPKAAIAFNTRPEDTADAAARWLKAD